ncbi:MAG: hypothetical protein JO089_01715 [Alphaproteobacteria bacterium]|nr:hypothetical protein [Alphaproteobacteria bacterium]
MTGPIGAVNNGAEFLGEEGFSLHNQAVELITSSAFSAVARLQFYRMAYGRVKEQGEAPLAEYQRMAKDFFSDGKIQLDWPDQYTDASGASLSLRMVRLLFNLLIVASAALLKGGTISVGVAAVGEMGKELTVTATGEALKWDSEIQQMLTGDLHIQKLTPKNVQLYLTRKLSEQLQTELTFSISDSSLRMRAIRKLHDAAMDELEMPKISNS